MYLLFILIGWILGISSMGKQLSMLDTSIHPTIICLSVFIIILIILRIKIIQQLWLKSLCVLILGCLAFCLGHIFADKSLDVRLADRITGTQNVEAIIYIDEINKISKSDDTQNQSNQKSKQKIWVLNQGSEPVQWLAYHKNPDINLQLGHYYRVSGQVKPAHSYAVEGVFDQEKWFIQENISGTLQINAVEELSENEINYSHFVRQQNNWIHRTKLFIEEQRLNFRERISTQPYRHQGLMLALLTGDESLLSQGEQDQFKRLGISHLLAISGPHVLIFASLFIAVFNLIINRFFPHIYLKIPKQYLILLPFCLCVWLYTAFVGFEVPAIRTLLTVMISALLLLLKQSIQPLKILLLSASILLIYDPFSILSAAFWLSYGACFILLRIYQTIQQQPLHLQIQWKTKLVFAIKILIESQWKIFIALFPLVIIIFKQISWVAPISNLFAIPIIGTLVVPLDVIAAVISLFSETLGHLIFHLADFSLTLLKLILDFIDQHLHAHLSWLAFSIWTIVCIFLGIFILFLPKGTVPKFWALICFIPILLPTKKTNSFDLTVMDIGQGQSIFIQLAKQNIMIDTGGYYDESKFSVGEQIVVPYLTRQGVNHIDQLILSHLDQDHSGAYDKIAQNIKIKEIYSSENDTKFPVDQFHYCYEGQVWQYDQIKIEVLHPSENSLSNANADRNEHSCVIYIQVPTAKNYQNFLIMGDAGWESEYEILKKYPDLKVDVLILGHHGSQHSSAYEFLNHLKPKLAIASAGFNNRYNHPTPVVVERLKELHIPFQTTIDKGSIRFTEQSNGEIKVSAYRDTWKWLKR